MNCRACCHSAEFRIFVAREMMFGWRHEFKYAECPSCGTIQIIEPPPNLSDYYPSDYYSLSSEVAPRRSSSPMHRLFCRVLLGTPGSGVITRRLALSYPFLEWARITKVGSDSAILDVGCGNGRLLRRMQRCGFTN